MNHIFYLSLNLVVVYFCRKFKGFTFLLQDIYVCKIVFQIHAYINGKHTLKNFKFYVLFDKYQKGED